ncbi:MAG: alpha/beta fold hydrolase [Burkholderiaceae bacterium]|jgi:pimeloyl-ACP methyl ester carboxylesterase|nr:alpha/beta fold hydrolase [Burkholderiales bacterium]MCZ8101502.1 alpha/beta fold hydrolase [Burkholderiales bacterium]MCZ8340523.1 alpha/beta fold hydrolase [Burkholderiaceae bacterium]
MHVDLPSGIRIEYDRSGPADAPAILLVMGLGMQLIAWPPSLVAGLVAHGFQVIRFDNRDVGLSSHVTPGRRVDMRAAAVRSMLGFSVKPPYTLEDMAGDAIGLLDALHVGRAHVVGVSMGGMIAQVLAAGWPGRVATMTSIMSSSGAPRFNFHWTPATRALLTPPPKGAHEAALLDHMEKVWMLIGSPGMQPAKETLRGRLRTSLHRAYDPGGVARQLLAIMASGDRRKLLKRITVPTLVIHGEADPLVPIGAGRDTAANIPGATFRPIPGMGHDLPEALVPRLVDEIVAHCGAAGRREAA